MDDFLVAQTREKVVLTLFLSTQLYRRLLSRPEQFMPLWLPPLLAIASLVTQHPSSLSGHSTAQLVSFTLARQPAVHL